MSLPDVDYRGGVEGLAKATRAPKGEERARVQPPPVWADLERAAPKLEAAARYGLVGRFLDMIEPHTEADPAALLVSFLVAFGNAVGPGPHMVADRAVHPARLFALVVGASAKARKGTSWQNVRWLFEKADAGWSAGCIASGLSSGEGLVKRLAPKDEGSPDRRLLVIEEEFGRVLTAGNRESSTLSAVLREAYQSGRLSVMTKEPLHAEGVHVSIVGHIVREELRSKLTTTDVLNGYGNRFLFVHAKRGKLLPDGGEPEAGDVAALARQTRDALQLARRVAQMNRDGAAAERWRELYAEVAQDEPGGMLDPIVARADAHLLRLSIAYALTDGSKVIALPHLEAAWSLWRYCRTSAEFIFGDAAGDETADRLLKAARAAYPGALDGRQVSDAVGRHVPKVELDRARDYLVSRGQMRVLKEETGGRPRMLHLAVSAGEQSEQSQQSP